MKRVARILVHGGVLIFNTGAPYDDQLIFDHADRYARSEGAIELDLEGVTWTVNATGAAVPCATCGDHVDRLRYARPNLVMCARCARTTRLVPLRPRGAHAGIRKPPRRKDGRSTDSRRQRPPDSGV